MKASTIFKIAGGVLGFLIIFSIVFGHADVLYIFSVILLIGLAVLLLIVPKTPKVEPLPIPEIVEEVEEEEIIPTDSTALGTVAGSQKYVLVKDVDRQSGFYALGVQGVGKSSLLEQLIYQDICKGYSVIVLDPHGDLIDHAISQLPENRLHEVFLLDIEDTGFPFGVNLFTNFSGSASDVEQAQALDRVLHVFEKCFPDTSRMLLEKYLGNIAPVFFANATGGYSMTDIPKFLRDDDFRAGLLDNKRISYFVREFWEEEYGGLSVSKRQTETASLSTRLNRFVRSPIVGNIIGQGKTTIDIRAAIEEKKIILVRLPVKTLKEDASLIGTMLIAQIHAAIFSFADTRLEDRPGFSLFVDEFQHFATTDFAEMFTEGRKFGSRVCIAHQFRGQIPDELASATLTARTIVCFQTTQEDAAKMGHLYIEQARRLGRADIYHDPVKRLLTYGHDNEHVEQFIKVVLRPLVSERELNTAFGSYERQIEREQVRAEETRAKKALADLNQFLFEAEVKGNDKLPIPFDVILGFTSFDTKVSNEVRRLQERRYETFKSLASAPVEELERLKEARSLGRHIEPLLNFLIGLRHLLQVIVADPLAEKRLPSPADLAQIIVNLPRRTAMVKVGRNIETMQTLDTPGSVSSGALSYRKMAIQEHTRETYCRSKAVVEREMLGRQRGIVEQEEVQEPAIKEDAAGSEASELTEQKEQASREEPKPRKRRAKEVDEDE